MTCAVAPRGRRIGFERMPRLLRVRSPHFVFHWLGLRLGCWVAAAWLLLCLFDS
jgi:hypothetical protein